MYSRKENTMANKQDSFDFDKFKSKEKKEKPIKEKKEKESSFDMGGGFNFKSRSNSFNTDKFKVKEKKEKPLKDDGGSFDVNKKAGFSFNKPISKSEKNSSFDTEGGSKISSLFKPKETEINLDPEQAKAEKKKMIIRLGAAGGVLTIILAIVIVITTIVVPTVNEYNDAINYVVISSTPNKTTYLIGEDANYEGLVVMVVKLNGERLFLDASDCEITGFDSSAAVEAQTISVKYNGFISQFNISVEEPPKPASVLTGIYLETLPKTEYAVGEWLDTTGGVIVREYMDGTTERIGLVNSYVYGWNAAYEKGAGTHTLTVKYKENGVIVSTTYQITITE